MKSTNTYGPSKGFLVGLGCLGVATVLGFAALFKVASNLASASRPARPLRPAHRCVAVTQESLAGLATGLAGHGISLRNGWAVRSRVHPEVTYVSAELVTDGSASNGNVETWAWAADERSSRTIYAVSPAAVTLSDWPDGSLSTFKLTDLDDDAEASRSCVRNHMSEH